MGNFYIGENSFRIWLPDVVFDEQVVKSENEKYNSRKIFGIMTTERKDRQGEVLVSKGLEFKEFLSHGHYNDNHSQDTSAIVGYPEKAEFHKDLSQFGLQGVQGWTCEGYVLKGTKRADAIWELAKALQGVPNRRLGFSVEGKVIRRNNKTIEKAVIRNVAITNCPVNTDCNWNVLEKSFHEQDYAIKALSAGFATSPATQTGGGALRTEDLDSKAKKVVDEKKKKRKEALERALKFDDLLKAVDIVLDKRPDFDVDAACYLVSRLLKQGE
jgi:hypothetical protein